MAGKKRMKLCLSCDGFVDFDVIVCPYCGSDFKNSSPIEVGSKTNRINEIEENDSINRSKMTEKETIASLYPPPYTSNLSKEEERRNIDDFSKNSASYQQKLNINIKSGEKVLAEPKDEKKYSKLFFIFTLMFSIGINLFFIGCFLLFFSKNGEIFLRWNSSLWYIYIILSFPILISSFMMQKKMSN